MTFFLDHHKLSLFIQEKSVEKQNTTRVWVCNFVVSLIIYFSKTGPNPIGTTDYERLDKDDMFSSVPLTFGKCSRNGPSFLVQVSSTHAEVGHEIEFSIGKKRQQTFHQKKEKKIFLCAEPHFLLCTKRQHTFHQSKGK